jgi:zinc and cadmium transporter
MLLLWIIVFSTLGSIGAIAGAALMLLFPQGIRSIVVPCLISYATGTLLGAAFLGMIPASASHAPVTVVSATVLAGLVLFFVLEKIVLWRHCHDAGCQVHSSAGPLILVGDAFHNFVDGVVIATAFFTSIPLGIAAALAVIAHEVPQEVGDFAILLDSGYNRSKALILNTLSAQCSRPCRTFSPCRPRALSISRLQISSRRCTARYRRPPRCANWPCCSWESAPSPSSASGTMGSDMPVNL